MDVIQEGDKFSSYDEFLEKLKKFQKASSTQFTTLSTERLLESDPLRDKFHYRYMRYHCKQGQRKKDPESKQARPQQRSFKVGCKVGMNVRLTRPKDQEPFLRVTKLHMEHEGHEASKEIFNLYPEQRRIAADEVDMTVLSALTMRTAEQRQIIEKRHGGAVFTQDIYNLQRKLGVGKGTGGRDEDKCGEIVRDIIAKGGHGEVGRDEKGDFLFVAFQTYCMRQVLNKFPECLIVDCTYKVNHYLYPLLTIMVIDGEGHGMPVFHAFLAKEDRFIMEKCLHIFARQFNPDSARCFIVDKDMAEIAAIGAVFPGVPVNLCQFHISQAMERFLKKELGRGASLVKVVLDSFMSQVCTESDSEFDSIQEALSQIVPQSVIDYFQLNWWSKKHLWAACCNINVVKFHATTTNTLESYHGKIKKVVNEKLSLSNVLSAIVSFDESKIVEKKRVETVISNSHVYNLKDTDATSIMITSTMTRFGAQLVKEELLMSEKINYSLSEGPGDAYTVSYKERQHMSTVSTCTCSTFCHFGIPCRHIFYVRRYLQIVLFDSDAIPARFRQSSNVDVTPPSDTQELVVTTVPSVPFSLRTVEGRYRKAKLVCDEAANFLSILGVSEFQQKLQELQEFIKRWSRVSSDDMVDGPAVFPVDGPSVSIVSSDVIDCPAVSPFDGPAVSPFDGPAVSIVSSDVIDCPAVSPVDGPAVSIVDGPVSIVSSDVIDCPAVSPVDGPAVSIVDGPVSIVSSDVIDCPAVSPVDGPAVSIVDGPVSIVSSDVIDCPAVSPVDGPAVSIVDGPVSIVSSDVIDCPAVSPVDGPAVSIVDGPVSIVSSDVIDCPAVSPVDGPAVSIVDGPVSIVSSDVIDCPAVSPVDGPAVSIVDGPVSIVSSDVIDCPAVSPVDGPAVSPVDGPSHVDNFSWPNMNKLLKPRGRPGTRQRFTKLSTKRRREIPKVFSSLSEDEKINLLIQSVSDHVSRPIHLITADELKHFTNFNDTVLDEKVDMSIIEAFFERAAWELILDGVATRIADGIFSCGHCKEVDDGELKMVQCEHCLKWYHFECVNYSSKKKVKTWFCDYCV